MKLVTSLFISTIILAGCGSEVNPVSIEAASTLKNVPGLQDCQAFKGMIDGRVVTIIRCPNSTTSSAFTSGKSTIGTVTIDEQAQKEAREKLDAENALLIEKAKNDYEEFVKKLKR